MADVLVYAVASRERTARKLLGAACQASGIGARLELHGSGSLYQRLGPRRAAPFPDLVIWFGPFAAGAAAIDGLLQPYQPPSVADALVHDPDWRWTTLDYASVGMVGPPGVVLNVQDLAAVGRLAFADPERSEVGLSILLTMLDRARQVESDVERGWSWWQQRMRSGVELTEDDASAVAMVGDSGVSHALSLAEAGSPLAGLAPVPHAIGLAAGSRNADAARHLLDWLTGAEAGAMLRLSPWQAASNSLRTLLSAAPALDVEWARQQYTAARTRWSQSGFTPILKA
jgi:ABC-type Fe3+ transport system substrate-binding protein